MSVLVVNQREVEELLDMDGCIEAMEQAFRALASGELYQPLRFVVRPPDRPDFVGLMPSHRAGATPLYALKTVCVVPDNPARGLDPHQGTVTLYDGETGETRAVINATAITAIRTAACSAVATRALARSGAQVVAIVGAGHQARAHLTALRGFGEIRIASRSTGTAEQLARDVPNARAVPSVEEAVRDADVVVTVTTSTEPVLRREWLKPGAHVNAVGACLPHTRELDTATVAESVFVVDRRESAENEAGDYLIPLREGAIDDGHIHAELGEVLTGRRHGRTSDEELTVFESLGIAVEDLFAAEYVVARARQTGRGVELEF